MATIFKQKVVSNSVAFNDSPNVPTGAQMWGVDIMDGWKDTGEPTELSTELGSYRDGSASASWFPVRKRYVTVGGYVLAATEAQAEELSDVLVRDAFPRNQVLRIERYEAVPKFVLGRRSTALEMDWSAVRTGFRWQTTIMCEDPFKYGLTPQGGTTGISGTILTGHSFPVTFPMSFSGTVAAASGVNVYNAGTVASSNFTALVNGNLSKGAWRLVNETNGGTIGFNVALGVSDQLLLDFHYQTATLNGVSLSASYLGQFWRLAPGSNSVRLYAEYDASASATITGYSAWE